MRRSVIAYSMCIGALLGCAPAPESAPPPRASTPPPSGQKAAPHAASDVEAIQAVGDCRIAKGHVAGVEVLMVTHERAGVGLVLPPLPSLELDCSAELGKKRPGLLFSAYFKRSDAYVALFSEPSNEVLLEKRVLEAIGAGHAKKLGEELKATPREISVDGLPGAMIASVVADVPNPKGGAVTALQLVTVRQRSSDKRVFSLWVSLGEPTPEERALWRSYLAMPANPVVQTPEGEPLVPEAPKNAATY